MLAEVYSLLFIALTLLLLLRRSREVALGRLTWLFAA